MVPLLGWMMDRWSIRRVALPGIVIYASAIALLALSPRSFLVFTLLFALYLPAELWGTGLGAQLHRVGLTALSERFADATIERQKGRFRGEMFRRAEPELETTTPRRSRPPVRLRRAQRAQAEDSR